MPFKLKSQCNNQNIELSATWAIQSNRALFSERKECGGVESELLSVTQDRGIIKQSDLENKRDGSNEDKSKYKRVYINDLAYNKMRMWQGAIGCSEHEGIVSPAYVVLEPSTKMCSKYFYYLFKTPLYLAQIGQYSYGLCDDMNSLRYEDFRNMESPVPPYEEQVELVNGLEELFVRIDRFIENKNKTIAFMNEQRGSIINFAVKSGLMKNAILKNSNEKWLGQIPIDWEKMRLKYCLKLKNQKTNDNSEYNILIGLENIESKSGRYIETVKQPFSEKGIIFKAGDVLFGKLRPYLTKSIIAPSDGICVSEILVFAPKDIIIPEYLHYILISPDFIDEVNSRTFGAKMPRADWDSIGSIVIPIPGAEEQHRIVETISNKINIIDQAIQKAQREIVLINEYKTTLIQEVIFGNIDIVSQKINLLTSRTEER